MKETKISPEQIVNMAKEKLFIRGKINKTNSYVNYMADIRVFSAIKVVIDNECFFVEYLCSYRQQYKKDEFTLNRQLRFYNEIDFYKYLKEFLDHGHLYRDFAWEKESWTQDSQPEVVAIESKAIISHGYEGSALQIKSLSNPEVLVALARMEGGLRDEIQPNPVHEQLRTVLCHRLSTLISQQLKKMS